MTDIIRGPVLRVVDGDTFDMRVTHTGSENELDYNDKERVRIEDVDAPELDTISGQQSKIALERRILRRVVRCFISARDDYGRIVARVVVLNRA